MKNIQVFALSIISLIILFASGINAEYIFLADGNIIEGTITYDSATSITVRDKEKKIRKITRKDILRILYTEFKMSKVFVQKRDGHSVIAYMVDEDRTSITFRKDLYSPEEFTLYRSEIYFIADKNPSGLKGEAEEHSASLKWLSPYDPVKEYKIFIRTDKDKKFSQIDTSTKPEAVIKNLKSNTTYYFFVKAIDREDNESAASNELKITTKNVPPLPPKETSAEKTQDGNFAVKWAGAVDPDGTVKGYRLYKVLNGKTSLLATVTKTEHVISGSEKFDRIFIKSFDNLNAESADFSYFYFGPRPEINFSIQPLYVFPMQNLKKVADPGYGITLRGGISNYYYTGLNLNMEASFIHFKGKNDYATPENSVKDIILVPVLLSAGYTFYPFKTLRVTPAFFAGVCYIQTRYDYYDIPLSTKKTITNTEYEPVFGAGLSVTWDIAPLFFGVSADYRYIAEESGKISYWYVSPCAGVRF